MWRRKPMALLAALPNMPHTPQESSAPAAPGKRGPAGARGVGEDAGDGLGHPGRDRHGRDLDERAPGGATHGQAAGEARIDADELSHIEIVLGAFGRGRARHGEEAIDLALVDAAVLERQAEGLRRKRERALIRQLALPGGSDSDDGSLPPGHSFPLEYWLTLLAERPTPFIAVLAERQLVEQLALEVEVLGPMRAGRHAQR